MIKKGLVCAIVILFIGMSVIPSTATNVAVKKSTTPSNDGNTLYVGGDGPGNYTTIQSAIDAASDGDTVFVYDDLSPYYEYVDIKKTINLIGEDRDTTIIEGGIDIFVANNVVVSGFTITNAHPWGGRGIEISSDNNLIHNNKIMYCSSAGIYIWADSDNTITNNIIIHNKNDGIFFDNSEPEGSPITWNVIGDNACNYYSYGLFLHRRGGYIHHNDFYMNWNENAFDQTGAGTWDDGSEGNYWDDWEDNPGYPDTYIIPKSYGPNNGIDYHPSPTPYFNYTIVSIWWSYHSGVNEPIWFEPRINVDPSSISSWFWDFGDGNTSTEMEPEHSYSKPGIFNISVTVIDSKGQSDTDRSKAYIGEPPDTPSITGPTNCKPFKWYNYTIVADDPDGGLLYYYIDWGDAVEENIGPYPAGEEVTVSHRWEWIGEYWIRVRAIDEAGFESDWAYLTVQVPRDKAIVSQSSQQSTTLGVAGILNNNEILLDNNPPYAPSNYLPYDGQDCVDVNVNLSWDGGDPDPGDTVTYDVYLDDVDPPQRIATVGPYPWNQTRIEYDPGTLEDCTFYIMMIVACDNHGASTAGPVCWFYTRCPPRPPWIAGPTSGEAGVEYDYYFAATDPDVNDFFYFIDWGDGTDTGWIGPYPAGEPITRSHSWSENGIYKIRAKVKNYWEQESAWSFLTVSIGNHPPYPPEIDGPTSGKVGTTYNYTFVSTDPNDDDIIYHIYWGDMWLQDVGPYPSGEVITVSHYWIQEGTYIIMAQAEDTGGLLSAPSWFKVTMPRDKATHNTLFLRFLERFPLLERLMNI